MNQLKEHLDSLTPEQLTELVNQQELTALRRQRDILLAETDWWVLPDRTSTKEQLEYRQALRDITDNYTSLMGVEWPIKP